MCHPGSPGITPYPMSLFDVLDIEISNNISDSALTTAGMLMLIENEGRPGLAGGCEKVKLGVAIPASNKTHFSKLLTAYAPYGDLAKAWVATIGREL